MATMPLYTQGAYEVNGSPMNIINGLKRAMNIIYKILSSMTSLLP